MRQVVLDTETTGLSPEQGHRIIEIGCVELTNRRLSGAHYQTYLQPDREIDAGAQEVHGIDAAFLADKPRFADVVEEFLNFVRGAELIIHNAPFDMGFVNHELRMLQSGHGPLEELCTVLDTLTLAREMHPGQRNSLDALCKRYAVDNSGRELHGALLDAQILADVYLAMTGGQTTLSLSGEQASARTSGGDFRQVQRPSGGFRVLQASAAEVAAHAERLDAIEAASDAGCVWRRLDS